VMRFQTLLVIARSETAAETEDLRRLRGWCGCLAARRRSRTGERLIKNHNPE